MFSRTKAAARASPACCASWATRASPFGIWKPAKARWRRSSFRWSEVPRELVCRKGDLSLRDGSRLPYPGTEYRCTGADDLALLCRVWLCHRIAHVPERRLAVWRLHRSRSDHAVGAYRERGQRLVRHLRAQMGGNDLRV